MSKATTPGADREGGDWVEEHRDELEREAKSEAPDSWVFERILAAHDGGEN